MIYLIGGAPRCGKTILSKAIAASKQLPWISIDVFRSGIVVYIPRDEVKDKLPDENLRLETSTPEELLQSELLESQTLWPGVRAMIEHLIKSEQDYIIEGVQLMPELVQELMKTDCRRHIRPVYLIKQDLAEIRDGFARNKSTHDWLKDVLKDTELVERAARMVQVKSLYIADEVKKYGFRAIDMGKDFEGELTRLQDEF